MDTGQSKDCEHEHAVERTRSFDEEPKQPINIPNIIETALQTIDDAKPAETTSGEEKTESVLTSKDVKYLFSGAPHFMLEKGRHNHWYPHVLFPWDPSLPIQDLWDRELLRHESFTLSTLHAHLPVPTNLPLNTGSSSNNNNKDADEAWKYDEGAKRPTYDLGIFEVPNMLSMNGKEPGAIGFRHFLELATADAVRYKRAVPKGESLDPKLLSSMPLTEAFDTLSHLKDAYSQCNQDVVLDRHKLLCEGPVAWKRIGVRDVHVKDIVERLAKISDFRVEALNQQERDPEKKNHKMTLLDKESLESLHKQLFTKFLFPPPRGWDHHPHEEPKNQIEVLTRVLAVKGAWLDLSLPEWRLRVGQILWEMPPHADGDCMDCCLGEREITTENKKGKPSTVGNGLERKWLLLQLLLAGELLLRLDAIVHMAVLQNSKDLSVTAQDMRELDKLRHGKVNWDILFFQRFSDNVFVKYVPKNHTEEKTPTPPEEAPTKLLSLRSKFGSISHHFPLHRSNSSAQEAALTDQDSVWDCVVTAPRRPERQLKGISVFAEIIGWPGHETLDARIRSNVQQKEGECMTSDTVCSAYSTPVKSEGTARLFSKNDTYSRDPCHRYLVLHGKGKTGGWLSRSWLTGLVMPGESINQLLMATLLENDPDALRALGTVANLYGGLSYGGGDSTWWSTKSIVGRVLAALDGSRMCMGWVHAKIIPVVDDGKTARDTWFSIEGIQDPLQKNTRIRQGTRLAIESNPLGRGRVASNMFTIPVDDDNNDNSSFRAKVNKLSLSRQEGKGSSESSKQVFVADRASLSFNITSTSSPGATESVEFPLMYNSIFISSYTCKPPRGSLVQAHNIIRHANDPDKSLDEHTDDNGDIKQQNTHLPGHPLHKSYTYKYVPLQDLRPSTRPPVIEFSTPISSTPTKESPSSHHNHCTESGRSISTKIDTGAPADPPAEKEEKEQEPIWILDARFSRDKEAFARAWCAAVGVHALIGRAGRTCLACCVREARALGVGVVIRVAKPVS